MSASLFRQKKGRVRRNLCIKAIAAGSDIETVLTQVANHMLHSGDNCERSCSVTLVPKSLRPTGMNEVLQVGQGVEYHQDEKHVPIST